jgi:hypothetical protein
MYFSGSFLDRPLFFGWLSEGGGEEELSCEVAWATVGLTESVVEVPDPKVELEPGESGLTGVALIMCWCVVANKNLALRQLYSLRIAIIQT